MKSELHLGVPPLYRSAKIMSQRIQRKYFAIADKASLEAFLENSTAKLSIYFGRTTEEYPYTDHGCIVQRGDDSLYYYTVEGHGIGSNVLPPADLKNTVRRIFADCQRFCAGAIVTVEVQSQDEK
jgi:hypothetical protein